jgi:Zn-finger protein
MRAFYYCNKLIEIILPQNLKKIGALCFGMNYSLKDISIPNTVSEIDSGAFNSCSNLTYVHLPNNISCISDFLFYGCSQLQSIEIPYSVREIEFGAFFKCDNLIKVIVLKTKHEDKYRIKNIFQSSEAGCLDVKYKIIDIKEVEC